VPYFDGWIKNADGSFDLVFGYFNRNWQETVLVAPGPDNRVEPGQPDQGQPTVFLPRRQGWVYRVRVPSDFGKKVVTWTITVNGKTEHAYGELLPVEEITERIVMTRGGLNPGEDDPNKPPTIAIAPVASAGVGAPITLTAMVTDDGLPKPRSPAPVRTPATGDATTIRAQANSSGGGPRRGLNVTWMQLRGPAKVTFEPSGPLNVTDIIGFQEGREPVGEEIGLSADEARDSASSAGRAAAHAGIGCGECRSGRLRHRRPLG